MQQREDARKSAHFRLEIADEFHTRDSRKNYNFNSPFPSHRFLEIDSHNSSNFRIFHIPCQHFKYTTEYVV